MVSIGEIFFFVSFFSLLGIFFTKLFNSLWFLQNYANKDEGAKGKNVAITIFLTIANIVFFGLCAVIATYDYNNMILIILLKYATFLFLFSFSYVLIEIILYMNLFTFFVDDNAFKRFKQN